MLLLQVGDVFVVCVLPLLLASTLKIVVEIEVRLLPCLIHFVLVLFAIALLTREIYLLGLASVAEDVVFSRDSAGLVAH
jgi:hypothetical protein